ncbi:MAG: hypothetical protein QF381_01700 [Nitrososphaerales archaeon]|nr:hypothetical protein [Nitrososphaerales archaeon]
MSESDLLMRSWEKEDQEYNEKTTLPNNSLISSDTLGILISFSH